MNITKKSPDDKQMVIYMLNGAEVFSLKFYHTKPKVSMRLKLAATLDRDVWKAEVKQNLNLILLLWTA